MASKQNKNRPSGKTTQGTESKDQPVKNTQEQTGTETQDVQGQESIADGAVSPAGGEQAGPDADAPLAEVKNAQGDTIAYGDVTEEDVVSNKTLGATSGETEGEGLDDIKAGVAGAERRSLDESDNPADRDDVAAAEEARTTKRVGTPEGKIIREGEDISVNGTEAGDYVIVTEDHWKEFFPLNSKRPSYTLLYGAGTAISKADLDRLS